MSSAKCACNKVWNIIRYSVFNIHFLILLVALGLSIFSFATTKADFGWVPIIFYSTLLVSTTSIRVFIAIMSSNNPSDIISDYDNSKLSNGLNGIIYTLCFISLLVAAINIITFVVKKYVSTNEDFLYYFTYSLEQLFIIAPVGLIFVINFSHLMNYLSLLRRNVNIRDMASIDALTRSDIIVIDEEEALKTNNRTVDRVIPAGGLSEEEIVQIVSNILEKTQYDITLQQALESYFSSLYNYTSIANLNYNYDNRYAASTFSTGMTYLLGEITNMDIEGKDTIVQRITTMESLGNKVIVLAKGNNQIVNDKYEGQVKLVAYILLKEEAVSGSNDTFKWLSDNGYDVKIFSSKGTNEITTIAKSAGFTGYTRSVSGDELNHITLSKFADEGALFSSMTDAKKESLIDYYRNNDKEVTVVKNEFIKIPTLIEKGRILNNSLHASSSLYFTKSVSMLLAAIVFYIIGLVTSYKFSFPFTFTSFFVVEVFALIGSSLLVSVEKNNDRPNRHFIRGAIKNSVMSIILVSLGILFSFIAYIIHINDMIYTGVDEFGYLISASSDNRYGASAIAILVINFLMFVSIYLTFKNSYKKALNLTAFLLIIGAMIITVCVFSAQTSNFVRIDFSKVQPVNYIVFGAISIALSAVIVFIKILIDVIKEKK